MRIIVATVVFLATSAAIAAEPPPLPKKWYPVATEQEIKESSDLSKRLVVSPKTAASLVAAGLAEIVDVNGGRNYIFLGNYSPWDES